MPADSEKLAKFSILAVRGGDVRALDDTVATEAPLEIKLSYLRKGSRVSQSLSVTMCTPGDEEALAAGFLFTEGLIDEAAMIVGTELNPEDAKKGGRIITVRLRDDVVIDLRKNERNFLAHSSCGLCGKTRLDAVRLQRRHHLAAGTPQLSAAVVRQWPQLLLSRQEVFAATGGLHAAALMDGRGELLAVAEDVGRHNAVDKLIGARLRAGQADFAQTSLFVSARASFELMQKAVMAGIPVLAAVGAPSSAAVELARETGATLLGFVRAERFNIYSGAQRIADVGTA